MSRSIKIGITILFTICCNYTIKANITQDTVYYSESLTIIHIAPQTYLHISYLFVPIFGKVPCNGLVCHDEDQSFVIDTPASIAASEELISWIQNKLDKHLVGVVATHFHEDCLGGLSAFQDRDIQTFSGIKTQDLSKSKNLPIPEIAFEETLHIQLGNEQIILDYLGEGHTADNIIAFFTKDNVLFGGCLVKSFGSAQGNIDDANVKVWPQTVNKVKQKYAQATVVVPGHGKYGGQELLAYTNELFSKSNK